MFESPQGFFQNPKENKEISQKEGKEQIEKFEKNYPFENIKEENFLSPDFLEKQIDLPKEKWDKKFKKLIEEEIKKKESLKENQKTLEEAEEITFKRYLMGLGLKEEDLYNKRILDLGCGEGEFIKSLIEKGITKEAYGIDINLNKKLIEEKFKNYFVKGNFENELPLKDIDYIVSVGAVSNAILLGERVMNLEQIFKNAISALKENGEIRIYPIQKPAKATPLESLQKTFLEWKNFLENFSKQYNIEYKLEPRKVKVTGKNNDIILESVLIIRNRSK